MAHLNDIYEASFYTIPWITFLVALGGSAHCAGMCGGLVIAFTKSQQSNLTYQLGRLSGYLLLGLIGSVFGSLISYKLQSNTFVLLSTGFVSLILIYMGIKIILKQKLDMKLPAFSENISKAIFKFAFKSEIKNQNVKSYILGTFSIFLPCGFLYGTVLVLSSFYNPVLGMISMFTFWLGTTPAVSFAPYLLKKILIPLQKIAPTFSSLSLICLGVLTLGTKLFYYFQTGSCQ